MTLTPWDMVTLLRRGTLQNGDQVKHICRPRRAIRGWVCQRGQAAMSYVVQYIYLFESDKHICP